MESINAFIPKFSSTLLSQSQSSICPYPYILKLCEETSSISSNSFLCLLTSFYLKSSNNIILLSQTESLHHYTTILRKFSINLSTSDSFCFVDILSAYSSLINTEFPLSENYPYTYNPNRSKCYISCLGMLKNNYKFDYDKLVQILNNNGPISKFKANSKQTVMIIDYTIDDYNEINTIIKLCLENNIHLITTVNQSLLLNSYDKNDLVKYYDHLSDIIISFKANESGHSKDIDGIISILFKSFNNALDNNNNSTTDTGSASLRYSIKENTIAFFTHLII